MRDAMQDRLVRTGVYVLVPALLALLWGFSGAAKLLAGGVPAWFTEQFGATILAKVPGLTISFFSLAILETLAAVIALGSLLRGEFLRSGRPVVLYAALLASLVLFVQLSVGKQLLSDFAGIHDLFMYFAGTLVMLLAVRALESPASCA